MSPVLTKTVSDWSKKVRKAGFRHDAMMKAIHALTFTAAAGRPGYTEAIAPLAGVWEELTGGESHRVPEFDRMIEGSLVLAAASGPFVPLGQKRVSGTSFRSLADQILGGHHG